MQPYLSILSREGKPQNTCLRHGKPMKTVGRESSEVYESFFRWAN